METPDKIYVERKAIMYDLVNTEPCKPDDLAYIRKDALIEWANNGLAFRGNGVILKAELIKKLESM